MEQQPKKNNTLLYVILGVVALVLCIVCAVIAYFAWQAYSVGNLLNNITVTNTATTTSSTTTTSAAPKTLPSNFKSYSNTTFNFSFGYPSNWRLDEKKGGGPIVQIFSPQESSSDTFLENMNVVVDETPNSFSLDEVVQELSTSYAKQFANFNLIDTKSITVGGRDAREMTYTATVGGVNVKQHQVYLKDGDRGYFFTYSGIGSSFDKFEDNFNTILDTVEFK